jgi:hypothetical protein
MIPTGWIALVWETVKQAVNLVPGRYYLYAIVGMVIFFAGCRLGCSCHRAEAGVHDPTRKAAFPPRPPQEEVARGAELVVKNNVCPVTGGPCQCGCAGGAPCNCAAGARWFIGTDGTFDLGLWQGERLLGRWFARTNTYRPYTLKGGYGAEADPPVPVPQELKAWVPTPAHRLQPEYPFYRGVSGGFRGGC